MHDRRISIKIDNEDVDLGDNSKYVDENFED